MEIRHSGHSGQARLPCEFWKYISKERGKGTSGQGQSESRFWACEKSRRNSWLKNGGISNVIIEVTDSACPESQGADSAISIRIDNLCIELKEEIAKNIQRIDETNKRIDETNRCIDRLYEVIVRREEHVDLERRYIILEERLEVVEKRLAA